MPRHIGGCRFLDRSIKLKGLKRYHSAGIYYVYHRQSNTVCPRTCPRMTSAFLATYMSACASVTAVPTELELVVSILVADVAQRYLRSREFRQLSESYQNVRRRDIDHLCDEQSGAIAGLPFKSNKEPHIRAPLDKMEIDPSNQRLKTFRALCEFARTNTIIAENPTVGIKQLPI